MGMLWRLNELIYVKNFEQYLAQNNYNNTSKIILGFIKAT